MMHPAHPNPMSLLDDAPPPVDDLPQRTVVVVGALKKNALGIAIGAAAALWLGGLAVAAILLDPQQDPLGTVTWLLGQNFIPGYDPTWHGAIVGMVWGFALGYGFGWVAALTRNRYIKFEFWLLATRSRLAASRDVLDEIS